MKELKIVKKKTQKEKWKLLLNILNLFKEEKPFVKKEIIVLSLILEKGFVDREYLAKELNMKDSTLRVQLSNLRKKGALDSKDNIVEYFTDLEGNVNLDIYVIENS